MQTDQRGAFSAGAFEFEPVTHTHLPMLRDWLSQPFIQEWWDDPEKELNDIKDMIEGRDTTRPFIFSHDGKVTGYIQYWFADDAAQSKWVEEYPWIAGLAKGTVGIDLLIADEENLSKGIGSSVVKCLAEKLVADGHDKIVIDPEPDNKRAVRAYEKAGFVARCEHESADWRILLMDYNPEHSGQPS